MRWPVDDLNALAETVIDFGLKNGADELEVSLSEATEFSVEVRHGEIEKLIEAGSRGLSFKIIIDHKVATASTSDLSPDTLKRLIQGTRDKHNKTTPANRKVQKARLRLLEKGPSFNRWGTCLGAGPWSSSSKRYVCVGGSFSSMKPLSSKKRSFWTGMSLLFYHGTLWLDLHWVHDALARL